MTPAGRKTDGAGASPADFDLKGLYAALDEQRRVRGLSWQGATREISGAFGRRPGARPLSASTIAGLPTKTIAEGDGVLGMLCWLGRTPESFVPGHPAPSTPQTALPPVPADRILRWDVPALHRAINARRIERGMTWAQVAAEVGGFTPAMLTGLAKAQRTGFPRVMRLVAWLGEPAARFTRLCTHLADASRSETPGCLAVSGPGF